MLDGSFDNEAFHCQMVEILTEWRTGYRILLALILMSPGLAGCTVGSDFVVPSLPAKPTMSWAKRGSSAPKRRETPNNR